MVEFGQELFRLFHTSNAVLICRDINTGCVSNDSESFSFIQLFPWTPVDWNFYKNYYKIGTFVIVIPSIHKRVLVR